LPWSMCAMIAKLRKRRASIQIDEEGSGLYGAPDNRMSNGLSRDESFGAALWGAIGIGLIALVLIILWLTFRRFGRR